MATREQVNTDAVQVLANKTLAAPLVVGGLLNAAQLAACLATADPAVPLGVATKQYVDTLRAYVDALIFSTGDIKTTFKAVADPGWVLMNDGTIGSAGSGGTTRANADTEALYTLLWNNIDNTWAPVSGGRGANAAADFAANKTLTLPQALGRALANIGTGTIGASGGDADVNIANNTLAVPVNNSKWFTGLAVVFSLASGTITGLTSGLTYFVIRDSANTIKLATTLALAQAGTAIDFTAKAAPVWSVVHTFLNRVMGEADGEQAHSISLLELPAHGHTLDRTFLRETATGVALAGGTGGQTQAGNAVAAGASAPMSLQPPTLFLNVMVKL
jgi:hypothetical protein